MSADLFHWRDEADAAEAVERAEAARAQALRRAHFAPHGTVAERRRRAQEATAAALAAEVRAARIKDQEARP
jgi:hypothetical protein